MGVGDWLKSAFSGAAGGFMKGVTNLVDEFHLSGEEKNQFLLAMESLLQKRDSEIEQTIRAELGAKERVLIAELTQGDNYTKRARPTAVYTGLAVIVFNYSIVPVLLKFTAMLAVAFGSGVLPDGGIAWEPLQLPTQFWVGWSGIVATWSIGRSAEKRGVRNKAVQMITGSKLLPTLTGMLFVACMLMTWA